MKQIYIETMRSGSVKMEPKETLSFSADPNLLTADVTYTFDELAALFDGIEDDRINAVIVQHPFGGEFLVRRWWLDVPKTDGEKLAFAISKTN